MDIKIVKPTQKNKKYKAIVTIDKKQQTVHFGDVRYEHYKDSTPLKLWSHLNHNDLERRRQYHIRHKNNNGLAGLLAKKYLW